MSEPNTDLQPGDIVELNCPAHDCRGKRCVVLTKTLLTGGMGSQHVFWPSFLLAYFHDVDHRAEFNYLVRLPTEVKTVGRLALQEGLPTADHVAQNCFWWILFNGSLQPFYLTVKEGKVVGYNLYTSNENNSWRDGIAFALASTASVIA